VIVLNRKIVVTKEALRDDEVVRLVGARLDVPTADQRPRPRRP